MKKKKNKFDFHLPVDVEPGFVSKIEIRFSFNIRNCEQIT